MGQLGMPVRTERITYERPTLVSDGASGSLPGPPLCWSTLAEVKPLPSSRLAEANQTTIRQGYTLLHWISKDFEPQVGDTVIYRDERLSVQGFVYADNERRRYKVTVLEEAKQGNGEVSN